MLSSSSSRPAPAQSILRKPRPSFSGPRPTPRFALPSGEPSEAEGEAEEQSRENTAANDDAATSSAGSVSGSTDTNRPDHPESRPTKASSTTSKAKGKRDTNKLGKIKASKKKFVVNSTASKRRTVVSKRSGSHGSQSSGASEGPGSREAPSYLAPRHSGESLIEVEEETEDDILPATLGTPESPGPIISRSRTPKQRQPQQTPALTEKAAGKQPVRPQSQSQPDQASSPASESTAVSSMSGSATGSIPDNTVPAPVPATTTRGARSSFAQYVTGVSGAPGSLASSGGSSGLEMPVALRNRQAATQRASLTSAPALSPRPGGGLIRQSTLPYEIGQSHRQQLGRIGSSTAMPSARGHGNAPPTSAYMSPSSGAAPGLSAATIAAPQMGRSMSQDSYGVRPRLGYQSPVLGPMRSSTVAAPSMVAASGVFLDGEGPDPFELYAKTGLDDPLEDFEGRDLAPYVPESGSFSSTFQSSSSFQNSSSFTDSQPVVPQRPLFTPTRPTQTPRIPFARTRSQLNVILGREKERLGEGSYASWQESRASRDHHDQHGEREQRGSRGSREDRT
ncbi:hypothetical protein SEUCBS140593_007430 [Sporothrix eucalyptigena]|uniref:Proteophosphoglycan ppg4 n=1 Tax=Sporothrix eucalyptigena TaxID=1812306 RepID=A0ABP0CD58_9PEZI